MLSFNVYFSRFITLLKYRWVPFMLYLSPPFHDLMACSMLFCGLWTDWNKMNISFDFATLKRSDSLNLFLLFLLFRMLLHSLTRIGVICIAPHELPLTALGFPSLSTWIMASITGFQSNWGLWVSLFSAKAYKFAVNTNNNTNTFLNILSIFYGLWHLDI